jgi:hypothetical protein
MKKILMIIVLLIAMSSCSIEDDINMETTSVAVSAGNEFSVSTTGKNIQRGTLFAWISEMQIKATHTASGYISTTDFTLVANGTSGAGTKFIMDNVMIGSNTFTASSKTTEPERLETAQVLKTVSNATAISNLNSRNPYALYTSIAPVNYTITQGTAQNVNIPMKTDNSRLIALFNSENVNTVYLGKTVNITCYVNGAAFGPAAICDKDKNATFYWSDRNSVAGKSIYFKIVVNQLFGGPTTYDTPAIVMKASNTVKIMYSVNSSLTTTPM